MRLTKRTTLAASILAVGEPPGDLEAIWVAAEMRPGAAYAHGRSALRNLVMGSVATKVLAVSKVPLLLLK